MLVERLNRIVWTALVVGLLGLEAARAGAAQPQFVKLETPADFLGGELDGLSVDSDGHVTLAPAAEQLFDTGTPYVWALAADVKGTLYAGTGNEGRVFRVRDGKGEPFFKADELEVHALALGPDGRLYAGSSPDGKVYVVDANGQGRVFFDPPEKYIWGLAFDAQGRLLVATGAEARLHRVDRDGRNDEVLFTSPETHFTALALDREGNTYVGTAPGGVIVRLDSAGKAFVLADTAFSEVKALDVAPDGSLYAALFAGDASTAAAVSTTAATPVAGGGEATVTISETFAVAPSVTLPGTTGAAAQPASGTGAKGAVLRLQAGDLDTLWSSAENAPHALAATGEGVLVGTGDEGRLFRVRDDHTWAMLASFPAQQVTALARLTGGGVALATSNTGKLHQVGALPRARGTFTSAAKDSGTVSSWGQMRFETRLPEGTQVQIQTRSGNTQTPDGTWSEWSSAGARAAGDAVASPKARFLQVRATLVGAGGRSPLLESVSAAYLQRNLRPQVTTLTVHPPGQVFQKPISVTGEIEVLGLDVPDAPEDADGQAARNAAMAVNPYSRKLVRRGIQTLSWKADDLNQDTLLFDLSYRRAGDSRFRPLRQGLTEPVYAWDTTALPNGRYVVKVTARDTPSNPPGLALSGEKESTPFEIDNTPPSIVAALVERSPARVRVTARDDGSLIRRAEYAVDGQRWSEVYPRDGINDSPEETYEITLVLPATPGPHIVVVRVTDLLDNVASAQVEVP